VEYVADNNWSDFGGDLDHDPDPGILKGILSLRDGDSSENFLRSAALAEVCAIPWPSYTAALHINNPLYTVYH